MSSETFASRCGLLAAAARVLRAAPAFATAAVLTACSGGGAPTTVNQQATPGSAAATYTGPAASNADVQAFRINLWENIRQQNRCGACHHEGGQSPMFARSDDVNLAYQAVGPLVNYTQPDQSALVLKVRSGHNCWVADPQSCADTMLTWIKAWVGAGSAATTGVKLVAPVSQTVGAGRQFPVDPGGFQSLIWSPILKQFCSNCHNPNASTPQTPYFADPNPANINTTYVAAQPKINLNSPALSRFVVRLRDEFHNCWATTPGGPPDCAGSAAVMLAAISTYAGGINPTPVDPTLVLSRALTLKQGTIASGGNRFESNLVAKYEFKTGTGTTAYDTSGVDPQADLTFTGSVAWVGGWGINLGAGGKAQAATAASKKLADLIKSTGEYSIEVWAAPANVAQTDAYIVSYSGSATTRNATLGQHGMQYEARTRSDKTDTNGTPALLTAAANRNAQAALQHLVLTYDPVNGQKIYVNGQFTGDLDPAKGGGFANWDDTFALVLGNETTGNRQWMGVLKFAAIHNRALTSAQVRQNFAAGVGERYFVLFDVSSLSGVSQSYVMFTGSVYDSYSYMFTNPTFISLDANAAAPAGIAVQGMRIGVNGVVSLPGQTYATLNATLGGSSYTAAGGQLLSSVGAVIAADKGVDTDLFFLSFDRFGSATHVFTEPVPVATAPLDNPAAADIGIRAFAEINATLAAITGVPATDSTVNATYNTLQQSLPSASNLAAFVASNQAAISQLATAYCGQLVAAQSYRDAFFGGSLDANLTATSASYFGTSGPNGNRSPIIGALAAKAVGTGVNAAAAAAITAELNGLLDRVPTLQGLTSTPTVSVATRAACTAALGSSAVSLK